MGHLGLVPHCRSPLKMACPAPKASTTERTDGQLVEPLLNMTVIAHGFLAPDFLRSRSP